MSRDGESWYKRKMRKRERSASMEANNGDANLGPKTFTVKQINQYRREVEQMILAMSLFEKGDRANDLYDDLNRLHYDLVQKESSDPFARRGPRRKAGRPEGSERCARVELSGRVHARFRTLMQAVCTPLDA